MRIRWSIFFIVLIGVASGTAGAEDRVYVSCPDSSELTVRGKANLQVPADQLQMRVGVVVHAVRADEALQLNTRKMHKLQKALEDAGLAKDEYQTGHFQIQPDWSKRPHKPAPDWRPEIIGYTVTNILQIRTVKIDLAGRLIETATSAGGNRIDAISFNLVNPRSFRAQAIAEATANAAMDARALAEAAGVRLGRVLSLRLDDAVAIPRRIQQPRMMEAAIATSGPIPDIIPGNVAVHAGVMMIYQLDR